MDPGAPTGIGDAIGAGAGAGENLLLLPPGSDVRFCTGGTVAGAETGAGIGGGGSRGSAEAFPAVTSTTPMKPVAMPPAKTRQVRAIWIICVGPSEWPGDGARRRG